MGSKGFTLPEVMVAGTIFLIGIVGAYMGLNFGVSQTDRANRLKEASELASRVAQSLQTLMGTRLIFPGQPTDVNDLLVDYRQMAMREQELSCLGPAIPPHYCAFEYPRIFTNLNLWDLTQALGFGIPNPPPPVFASSGIRIVPPTSSMDPNWGVYVGGRQYRIVWNIVDTAYASQNLKIVRVYVFWPPYESALSQGRFAMVEFLKGGSF
jgi:prepilin-type N-terminal cleavage/methylation domain-containing protein